MNPQFAALADEFEARVRGAQITPSTEVTLIYHCVDADGRPLPSVRVSLVPQTILARFGDPGAEFAAAVHRDTILGNVNSLVRHAPEGLIFLRGARQVPLRIVGFDLEIGTAPVLRIRLVPGGPSGSSLLVPKDLLDRVRAVLDRSSVSYWVEHNAISIDGRPAVAVINLRPDSDAEKIQSMLETAV